MNKILIMMLSLTFIGCLESERENPLLNLNTLDEMLGIYKAYCDPESPYKGAKECEEFAKTTDYSVKELTNPVFNKKYNHLQSIQRMCIRGLAQRNDKLVAEFKRKPECQSYLKSKLYKERVS